MAIHTKVNEWETDDKPLHHYSFSVYRKHHFVTKPYVSCSWDYQYVDTIIVAKSVGIEHDRTPIIMFVWQIRSAKKRFQQRSNH